MKTINIAVCLSGQPRTWRSAKENIVNYFDIKFLQESTNSTRINVDYFIHTWDTNSYRDKLQPRWENKDYPIQNPSEEQEIKEAFRPALMEYEKYDSELFNHAWQGLFYSFMKSVLLKRKFELQNDFVYDIVVKTRFDINFPQEGVSINRYPLNKFFVHKCTPFVAYGTSLSPTRFPLEFNYNVFDDVFFYAESATMDIISNVYRWYKDISDNDRLQVNIGNYVENPEFWLGPGTLLYRHLINWNIYPYCLNPISYYVVRKSAEDNKLHSINDWQKIRDISEDWYKNGYTPAKLDRKNDNKFI